MNKTVKYKNNVKTRSDLMTLLSEACELEHGLACSYLYTAFSLKQEMDEGVSAEQLHLIKKWASKIYYIASQEMLHLAQVWNLLNAIGGTPYYFRPNFPQPSKYYPFNVPLNLEPFSLESLKRFTLYELPSEIDEVAFAKNHFGFISEDDYTYKTVGELYRLISDGFNNINEEYLFIGNPELQMGQDDIDFREIIKISNRQSALEAIHMITHQGEGNNENRINSHYGLFVAIEQEYKEILAQDSNFQPSRNTISNPITYLKGNYSSNQGEVIINDLTRRISDLFDDVYVLMLRSLQFSFSCPEPIRKTVAVYAIHLMIRVIKPLGELLTKLPAYNDFFFRTAGASFALTRHVPLPNNTDTTLLIIEERKTEILQRMEEINRLNSIAGFDEIISNYRDVNKDINEEITR